MDYVGKINLSIDNKSNTLKEYIENSKIMSNLAMNNTGNMSIDEFDVEEIPMNILGDSFASKAISKSIESYINTGTIVMDGVKSIYEDTNKTVENIKSWWMEMAEPELEKMNYKVQEIFERTSSTVGVAICSIGEGVMNVGEHIVDFGAIVGTGVGHGIVKLASWLSGNDYNDTIDNMWNKTNGFVSKKHVSGWFDEFYEDNAVGRYLKEKSFLFDATRNVGNMVGEIAGVVAISVLTFGVGGAALTGGSVAVTGTQMAIVAGASGMGRGTEESLNDGASTREAVMYGALTGIWEGFQFWLGGKIGASGGFGDKLATKFLSKTSINVNAKLASSLTRVVLDGADGGIEGIMQPLLAMTYKDESYKELFREYGGMKNVATQAIIGSGMSAFGETFDLTKYIKEQSVKDKNIDVKVGISENEVDLKLKRYNELKKITATEDYIEYMDNARKGYAQVLKKEYDDIELEMLFLTNELLENGIDINYLNYSNLFNDEDISTLLSECTFDENIKLWSKRELSSWLHQNFDSYFGESKINYMLNDIYKVSDNYWPKLLNERNLPDNVLGFVDRNSKLYLPERADSHTAYHEAFHKLSEIFAVNNNRVIRDKNGNSHKVTGIQEYYPDGFISTWSNEALTDYLASKYGDGKLYDSMYGKETVKLWEKIDIAIQNVYGMEGGDYLLDSYLNNDTTFIRNFFDLYSGIKNSYDIFARNLVRWYDVSSPIYDIVSAIEKNTMPKSMRIKSIFKSIFGGVK